MLLFHPTWWFLSSSIRQGIQGGLVPMADCCDIIAFFNYRKMGRKKTEASRSHNIFGLDSGVLQTSSEGLLWTLLWSSMQWKSWVCSNSVDCLMTIPMKTLVSTIHGWSWIPTYHVSLISHQHPISIHYIYIVYIYIWFKIFFTAYVSLIFHWYSGWPKSYNSNSGYGTVKHWDNNGSNYNGINHLPTSASFLPSTASRSCFLYVSLLVSHMFSHFSIFSRSCFPYSQFFRYCSWFIFPYAVLVPRSSEMKFMVYGHPFQWDNFDSLLYINPYKNALMTIF